MYIRNQLLIASDNESSLGLQDVVIDEGSFHMAATSLNLPSEPWESNKH